MDSKSKGPLIRRNLPKVDDPAERRSPAWFNVIALLVSASAAAVVFLPFAFDTSPWDAVTLRVPGNQGNWWHALVGAPFFLAFPMVWLCLRSLFSKRPSTSAGRRLIWIAVGISICGTILVELPFLLHLAGTSEWQRLLILSLGFGILIDISTFRYSSHWPGIEIPFIIVRIIAMSIESPSRNTNWWGRATTIGLFVWFLYWFKNEPKTPVGQVLLWGPLALIHWFAIQAARRRFGWVYLLPLGLFWIIVIVALSGGIPSR